MAWHQALVPTPFPPARLRNTPPPPPSALPSVPQDGTAVVWDLRVGGQGQQGSSASVLDVAGGRQVHSRADHMQCLSSSSHVPCVRFDPTGSWLLCGHGSGALSSWSLAMPGCRAKQVATGFVPQVRNRALCAGAAPAAPGG